MIEVFVFGMIVGVLAFGAGIAIGCLIWGKP